MKPVLISTVVAIAATACTGGGGPSQPRPTLATEPGSGPLDPGLERELDLLFGDPQFLNSGDIAVVGASGDLRVAWPLVDLLRFHTGQTHGPELLRAAAELTGVVYGPDAEDPDRAEVVPWVAYSDLLLAHDVPAPPGYLRWKAAMHTSIDASWEPFFVEDADLDWREVSWGGVLRDGIPALTDPPLVPASEGDWLPPDDLVFGLVVEDEARAYPKRVLEVHEMVNDTLGGRRIAMPYCTLCRAATPYLVDRVEGVDEPLELRTSGLLQRSNKLAYDVQTESLWDQFSATAVSGPLQGTELPTVPVTVTTWGEWRDAHPGTTVTPEEIGGRGYGPDPLGGRDEEGPIFPVGEVDPRLGAQTVVFGVTTPRGTAVAFPVEAARRALRAGRDVHLAGVDLRLEAGGVRAKLSNGPELPGHEAFWFAWSQFHPGTELWEP